MILITGGTRSGKTAAAERLCKAYGQRVLYLAITVPSDPESKEKIKRSRGHRPYYWDTYETSGNIAEVIMERENDYDIILVDSINNLVFNRINAYSEGVAPPSADYRNLEVKILADARRMIEACQSQQAQFVFVTTELGMASPVNSPLQRSYCEITGRVNQLLAEVCSSVYLIVCGIDVKIK